MAPTTQDGVDLQDLAQRVQDLPAELYDMILEYTFTADEERAAVSWNYKPPARLQVSRATRDLFAKNYYIPTRFFVLGWAHAGVIDRFVTSLPMVHVNVLGESIPFPLDAREGESITDHEGRIRLLVAFNIWHK